MIKATLVERGNDAFGSGSFGASRGTRTHNGTDFIAPPGCIIEAYSAGRVTKHGYCYNDDPQFRYVEVTTTDNFRERYFYVDPIRDLLNDYVHAGDAIGISHSLQSRYKGIIDHIHFEIKRPDGTFIDPALYKRGYR